MLNHLANQNYRALVYFFILLMYAAGVLVLELVGSGQGEYQQEDKLKHYAAGKFIFTACYLCFLLIMSFVILKINKIALLKRIVWIPLSMIVVLVCTIIVVSIFAFGKEAVDSTGVGNVEWLDVVATFDGAYSPNIRSVFIMLGLTPTLIPLEIVLQSKFSDQASSDVSDSEVSNYLKSVSHSEDNPDVLLVEDDLQCSAVMMNFCKKLKLHCTHVETIKQAKRVFTEHKKDLKVIVCDIFVRVEVETQRETGLDFIKVLIQRYPKETREFKIIITTGHPQLAKEFESEVDYILKKPWDIQEMLSFFKEHKIV